MDIKSINNVFLKVNEKARRKIINELPVILLFNNDTLSLIQYGKTIKSLELNLETYHIIKSICHYICFNSLELAHCSFDEVIKYITDNKSIFKFEEINYWHGLYDMCTSRKINQDILSIAMKHCAIMFQTELHNAVQKYKSEINNPDLWNQLLVIVTGPPSPRVGHSAMQYFGNLTGNYDGITETEKIKKKNRKLYYVENVYVSDKILDIVGQLLLERRDYDKIVDMKTDILAYDTCNYLKKVCHKADN